MSRRESQKAPWDKATDAKADRPSESVSAKSQVNRERQRMLPQLVDK